MSKINALLVKDKKNDSNVLLWVLAIIGVVAAVAAICYALSRYFANKGMEDFEDEFDDDDFLDEEDIFEDEGEY